MRLIFALLIAALLSACGGSGNYIRQPLPYAPRTIYIEKQELDNYGLNSHVEMNLIRAGFNPVSDPAKATYRAKMGFDWNKWGMTAIIRITDQDGENYYIGQGKNSGMGTDIAPGSSMKGCIDRAMENLTQK